MALDKESQAKQVATIKAAREAARQETRKLAKEANRSRRKNIRASWKPKRRGPKRMVKIQAKSQTGQTPSGTINRTMTLATIWILAPQL